MFLRSWSLFCSCWAVLRSQPSLAIYPIISGISSTMFVGIFLVPLYFGGFFNYFKPEQPTYTGQESLVDLTTRHFMPWQMWIALFALGLILNIITNFCNAAFTTATMIRLSGNRVTTGEAFSVASARFPAILGYSLIGATVGLVLRIIEERVGFLGRLIGFAGGLAWAVVTFLVVPVLVVENVGPVDGIKRSMYLLRRTWGEGLICHVGIGMASGLISLVFMVLGALFIIVAVSTQILALIILAVGLTVLALIAVAVISRTLSGIFTTALYAYATDRGMMPGIPSDLIRGAFGPKTKKFS